MLLIWLGSPALLSRYGADSADGFSGGTFSRKRWHDLLNEEREKQEAEERRIRDAKLKKRAERRRKEAAFVEAQRKAREQAKAQGDALSATLAQSHAAAAARGVEQLREVARLAAAQAQAGHGVPAHDEADDEESLMLLLAHYYASR